MNTAVKAKNRRRAGGRQNASVKVSSTSTHHCALSLSLTLYTYIYTRGILYRAEWHKHYSIALTVPCLSSLTLSLVKLHFSFAQDGPPRVLIGKSNPRHRPLPKIDSEAISVQRLLGRDTTITLEKAGFSNIRRALRSYKITACHLIMHCNAKWVGLVKENGELDPVKPEDIINLFAPYSVVNGGSLNFIFINGCLSIDFGMSLNQAGFVVVCWQTLVRDNAAANFATAFYEKWAKGHSIQAAFNFAEEKIDVGDPKLVKHAAGIPRLLL